jgi:hypothetical protein
MTIQHRVCTSSTPKDVLDFNFAEIFQGFAAELSAKLKETVKASARDAAQITTGKRSNQPIQLDFANMISALEVSRVLRPGSFFRLETFSYFKRTQDEVKSKVKTKPTIVETQKYKLNNPLDSNAVIKRGKESEKPKNKKPSTLKKVRQIVLECAEQYSQR